MFAFQLFFLHFSECYVPIEVTFKTYLKLKQTFSFCSLSFPGLGANPGTFGQFTAELQSLLCRGLLQYHLYMINRIYKVTASIEKGNTIIF